MKLRLALVASVGLLIAGISISAGTTSSARAGDKDCSDFGNQKKAQKFFLKHGGSKKNNVDDLDADHNGIACESNPCPCLRRKGKKHGHKHHHNKLGVRHRPRGCHQSKKPIRVVFSKSKYPHIIKHIKISWRRGYPRKLVIWRPGSEQRRDKLLAGIPTKKGYDRDEAPAAVLRKKVKADVRYVRSHENRSAGSSLGNQIAPYCNGVRVLYRFVK